MAQKLSETIIAGGGSKLVRFSYANVFEPKSIQPGQPAKYSTMILIDKSDKETIKAFQDSMNRLIKAALAKGMWDGQLPEDFNKPLKDGDTNPPKRPTKTISQARSTATLRASISLASWTATTASSWTRRHSTPDATGGRN